jgi:hypothetical protein
MPALHLAVKPAAHSLCVQIHEPLADAECPIMQEPIRDAVLDWMPRPFDAEHPTRKAITTACGHTFHAMALVYHWARSRTTACPVCRAGSGRLVVSRLPKEWRYSLAARVRRERRKDALEREEADRAVAQSMSASVFSLRIRVESSSASWVLPTVPVAILDHIVFDVPGLDLRQMPRFDKGAEIRMVSLLYTGVGTIALYPPSPWFKAGEEEPGHSFSARWDEQRRGFQNIHFQMHDQQFAQMIQFSLLH